MSVTAGLRPPGPICGAQQDLTHDPLLDMRKARRERRKAREIPAGIPAYFEETDRRFASRSRKTPVS